MKNIQIPLKTKEEGQHRHQKKPGLFSKKKKINLLIDPRNMFPKPMIQLEIQNRSQPLKGNSTSPLSKGTLQFIQQSKARKTSRAKGSRRKEEQNRKKRLQRSAK